MKAQSRMLHGTPTVYFDDSPGFFGCHLVGYMYPDKLREHQEIVRKYSESGVHIYSIDTLTHEWVGPRDNDASHYDFSVVAPRMQSYIDIDPEAHFLLRMCFETRSPQTQWWNEMYPEELEELSDGTHPAQSFASEVWKRDVDALLRAYVEHLKDVGMYERVVAFQVDAGSSGEWIKDISCMMKATHDYSLPMRDYFRKWLHRKYGDEATFQRAWADDGVTFDSALVPSYEEQWRTTTGHSFRDPKTERRTIDYYESFAELCADDLMQFCRTVREITRGEKLVGAFFGYVMELAWNMAFFANTGDLSDAQVSTIQRSGHLGLGRVLRSPDLDFIVSPYGYAFRGLGGDGLPMAPSETLRLHGKFYLMEEDSLMHNNFDPQGRNHRIENSIAVYKRNFAQVITHAHGVTWFEVVSLAEKPSLSDERKKWIKRFHDLGKWGVGLDRRASAEVAIFLDDESYNYESNNNNLDMPLIWRQRVTGLSRFGAPHDVYLLDDLFSPDFPEYKLYVFLNAFHLSTPRREKIKEVVRRNGRTSLWIYAPGFIDSDAAEPLHTDHMTDLTGIEFGRGDGPWSPFMHITDFTHAITKEIPQDMFWGSTAPIGPMFHVEDSVAKTLGEVVYSLGRCMPGLCIKSFEAGGERWTSIYSAVPEVPAPLFRGIARDAGVHIYNDSGDVLYATRDLLSVHTVSGGSRHFVLPKHVEIVFDLFNGKTVAKDCGSFDAILDPASTQLYFTGSEGKVESLRNIDGEL